MSPDTPEQQARARDLRIVQSLLSAIRTGKFPLLARYEKQFRDFAEELSGGAYSGELWEFLARQPDVATEGITMALEKTLTFVREEIARYTSIKAIRPLTDAEKRYGKEVLLALLESAEHLLR